jgi:hypothetical protein
VNGISVVPNGDLPTFALSAGESWTIPAELINDLQDMGEIIIALDSDETGRRNAAKRARQLMDAGIITRAVDLQLDDGGDFADFRNLHSELTLSRLADLPEIHPAEPTRPAIQYPRTELDRRDEYFNTVVIPAVQRAATHGRKHFMCVNPAHGEALRQKGWRAAARFITHMRNHNPDRRSRKARL